MRTGECLQIGGGNIGRALIGEVMHDAGMGITFADVNPELIDHFNREGGYPVRVVSMDGASEKFIDGVKAIDSRDEAAMIEKIVSADIITTAVGARILPLVAPTLAQGLVERLRRRPEDELHIAVIACENLENNTHTLREHILANLSDDDGKKVLGGVSFPNCAVDRIVPNAGSQGHPLAVVTEDYFQLAVDTSELKEPLPAIAGIRQTDDLEAVLTQKLYTLNGPHAAAAYWAHLRGLESIEEAMRDPDIEQLVQGMMGEVSRVIVQRFSSISAEDQAAFADKTMRRFRNPHLKDQPVRVGREPKRKLGPRDRLLGPALQALDDGDTPANLTMAMVAGFRFDNPADEQAAALHHEIGRYGIDAAVVATTGLSKAHPLVRHTAAAYRTVELVV